MIALEQQPLGIESLLPDLGQGDAIVHEYLGQDSSHQRNPSRICFPAAAPNDYCDWERLQE